MADAHGPTAPSPPPDGTGPPVGTDGGRMRRRTMVALALGSAVLGFLMIGPSGAVVAPAAVAVGWTWRREPGRPVASVAALLLAGAAIATVVEATPSVEGAGMTFPDVRPTAGWLAALGGTLLAVAVLLFCVTERADRPAPRRRLVRAPSWARLDDLGSRGARLVATVVPWAAIAVVALAVRVVASPAGITAGMATLVANLRFGTTYASGPLWDGPTAGIAPLPAALLAYGPFGARLAVVVASMVAGAVACRLAWVQLGRTGALATAAVAALLPSMWDQPLVMVLAGASTAGAVALADPDRIDARRGALAGVAAGVAMLCAPDAVVVAPVLVAWVLLCGGRPGRRAAVWLVLGAALAAAPWWTYVAGRTGIPAPVATWDGFVVGEEATTSLPLVASVLVGAAVVAVTARVLGGARDLWRQLLPFLALPAWNVVLAVAALGDRDVLGWSAPLVAVVLGSALSGWWEENRRPRAPAEEADHLFA